MKVLLAARGQNRDTLLEAVSRLGHSVGVAGGGTAAARALRRGAFDLVLLEMGRHGERLAGKLRAIDAAVQVVACLPRERREASGRWLENGASDVLLLPPDQEELVSLLTRVETRRLRQIARLPEPRSVAPQAGRPLENRALEDKALETVDWMAAAIAHEINSPLDGAVRFLRFAMECVEHEPERARAHLEEVRSGLARISGTVRELIRFVRENDAEARIDLRGCLDEAVATLVSEPAGDRPIRFQIQVRPRACSVPAALRLAVANLLRNARDAAASVVRVTARSHATHLAIHVLDDGPGMPAEVASRTFEPFLSTKAGGIGLGLALSRTAAIRSGARLRLRSREGKGTVARIVVPLQPAVAREVS